MVFTEKESFDVLQKEFHEIDSVENSVIKK